MNFFASYTRFFQRYFPSPFSIAILLSVFTFIIAFVVCNNGAGLSYVPQLGQFWFDGIFNQGLLAFTVHMMLILVLGHILALSKGAQWIIDRALKYCTNTASSAFIICFLTICVAMFNWGLGLVFGAIFARKIGEHFKNQNKSLNYALIGASAYVGLMVWHGGLSGSAPLTVAGEAHSLIDEIGIIPLSETVFSSMNGAATILLLVLVPVAMMLVGKFSKNEMVPIIRKNLMEEEVSSEARVPAERFESNLWIGRFLGLLMLVFFIYLASKKMADGSNALSILNLSTTNLLLLGLALFAHGSIASFLKALEQSIGDVSGILIQFPLYFGIMGIMKESGLVAIIAEAMTNSASTFSLPIYTYLSAGLVNIFVPSGGGQWQIQGPIIAETALATGTSISKLIMALSYGDQLTNMLQPFWALPLLGITGLKAKDILPYTLFLFLLGFVIFLGVLIIF